MECEELKLKEDGIYDGPAPKPTFFDPSTPNVRDYNSHLADDWYRSYWESFNHSIEVFENLPELFSSAAPALCNKVYWEFDAGDRTADGSVANFASRTSWIISGYVNHVRHRIGGSG